MLAALSFLTIVGRSTTPNSRSLWAFPVVGAAVGTAVGVVWWGAGQLWPPLVAAMLAVAADAVLTGLLHLDGLSDSADGLLPPIGRERRLAVMRDPAVGAFGAVTLFVVLGLRVAAFASVAPGPHMVATVAALWCVSRASMAVVTGTVRYARADGGLASAFGAAAEAKRAGADAQTGSAPGMAWLAPALLGCVGGFGLAAVGAGVGGMVAVAVAIAAAAGVTAFALARIGGFTGDVLGALGVLAETAGLLAVAAW